MAKESSCRQAGKGSGRGHHTARNVAERHREPFNVVATPFHVSSQRCRGLAVGAACTRRLFFSSTFPLFVPRVSWEIDRFYMKRLKKGRI